jgi:DNA polymerase
MSGRTEGVTDTPSLAELRAQAAQCRACDLWERATQTVFGEGDESAAVMLIGEQPGDREDLEGAPFVGPAGQLLDRALKDARLDRAGVYVTNAVKHFKWTPRGKRRIHQRPTQEEIRACRPWLEKEIAVVRPRILVCMGVTAAVSVIGKNVRIMRDRGEFFPTELGPVATVTLHPSAVLRAPDEQGRHQQYEVLLEDLRRVAERVQSG